MEVVILLSFLHQDEVKALEMLVWQILRAFRYSGVVH
jgi:hypothetical protein